MQEEYDTLSVDRHSKLTYSGMVMLMNKTDTTHLYMSGYIDIVLYSCRKMNLKPYTTLITQYLCECRDERKLEIKGSTVTCLPYLCKRARSDI